ncbi:MAG: response regulator transcription factor [Bacteroidaceae bacterium]|nr:response regulator transcription factor [Bacteroidaceae bacterium]
MEQRILIVDDEEDIREILQFNLETEGYEVVTAASAEDALKLLYPSPALILLDVMMDGMSGFEMARKLKRDPELKSIPIIFITALDGVDNTVKGLNIGADDYMTKPLSMKVVTARVKAVLRRSGEKAKEEQTELPGRQVINYERLSLDILNKRCTLNDNELLLTKLEFELLALLLGNPGKVFSREEILQRIWPRDTYVLDRTVDVNINRIRKKIDPYGKNIKTRFGYGYTFAP